MTDDGLILTNRCDLCRNTRVSPGWISSMGMANHVIDGLPVLECPWCRAVRLKWGSYWQWARPPEKRQPEPDPVRARVLQILKEAGVLPEPKP